jgi:hypothetical protein
MMHLLVISGFGSKRFAYHFASDVKIEIIKKQREIINKSVSFKSYPFSIRILKTESSTFASIKKMDPYFEKIKAFSDIDLFFEYVKQQVRR